MFPCSSCHSCLPSQRFQKCILNCHFVLLSLSRSLISLQVPLNTSNNQNSLGASVSSCFWLWRSLLREGKKEKLTSRKHWQYCMLVLKYLYLDYTRLRCATRPSQEWFHARFIAIISYVQITLFVQRPRSTGRRFQLVLSAFGFSGSFCSQSASISSEDFWINIKFRNIIYIYVSYIYIYTYCHIIWYIYFIIQTFQYSTVRKPTGVRAHANRKVLLLLPGQIEERVLSGSIVHSMLRLLIWSPVPFDWCTERDWRPATPSQNKTPVVRANREESVELPDTKWNTQRHNTAN